MPLVPTVLFVLCGFVTLVYAGIYLGLGLWLVAPTLMLGIVAASIRMDQLQAIAKAAAMAAAVLSGIFVVISLVIAIARSSIGELWDEAPLLAGLVSVCVFGLLLGYTEPSGAGRRGRDS